MTLRRILTAAPGNWQQQGNCADADPDLMYPEAHGPSLAKMYDRLRPICHDCPVKATCLTEALDEEIGFERWGMRGGLTPPERDRVARGLVPDAA